MFTALQNRQWSLHSLQSQSTTCGHINPSCCGQRKQRTHLTLCVVCRSVPTAPLISTLACSTSDIHPFTSDIQGHSSLPFTLAFCPSASQAHTLAVADEDGHLSLLHTARPAIAQLNERRTRWLAHNNAVFDVQWDAATHCTLATASADQTVRLWDAATAAPTYKYGGHGGSVKCVAGSAWQAGVWASGGRDGQARVWDSRVAGGDVACVAVDAPQRKRGRRPAPPASSTVTAVAWLDERQLCTASSSSACARVWDVRFLSTSSRQQRCVRVLGEEERGGRQYGVSSLHVDSGGQHVLLSCTNHELVCYHWPSAARHCAYRSHRSNFYTRARFSPDGRYIACGSTTGAVHVYEHGRGSAAAAGGKGRRARVLAGHEDEVGGVEWGRGGEYVLASCGDDHTVRVWRADRAAAKCAEGEGEDEALREEVCEAAEDGKAEAGAEQEWHAMADDEKEGGDKENEPQHSSPLASRTPSNLLFTPTSTPSSSSSALSLSSPLTASSLHLSACSSPTPPSREPLADITNAVVEPRPAKRLRLSSAAKPLLAFFSPVDASAAPFVSPTDSSASPSSEGKRRRAEGRATSGRSPTLLDFWAMPPERIVSDERTEADMEY